jgi:hypothetical protein
MMGDHARVTASFIALRCNNRGGKAAGLRRHCKRCSKNEFMRHLNPRTTCPLHHGIRQLYPKWVP